MERSLLAQGWRFAVLGGANTLATAAIIFLLGFLLDARLAYSIGYLVGLVFTVMATPQWVFGQAADWRQRCLLAFVYVAVFLVGNAVIVIAERTTAIEQPWLGLTPILFTAPITFVSGRLLLLRRA